MVKVVVKKSIYPAWRAKYSTPFGTRWLTVHAPTESFARQLATLKTPHKAGWVFEDVEEATRAA